MARWSGPGKSTAGFDYERCAGGSNPLLPGQQGDAGPAERRHRAPVGAARRGRAAGGQPSRAFALASDPGGVVSYYKGSLFFIDRHGEGHPATLYVNYPWHVNGGSFTVLRPAPPLLGRRRNHEALASSLGCQGSTAAVAFPFLRFFPWRGKYVLAG